MKKHRIVLASILKPVDETRMFEKIGMTLKDTGDYEVFMVGQPAAKDVSETQIRFLPLPSFTRISFRRMVAPWLVLFTFIRVKPALIVICTHELLIVAVLYRLFSGAKIVYDVQENYYRNIRYTTAFPGWLRIPLAYWVRAKEKFAARYVDWFFLAEAGYQKELRFYDDRYSVIQNKFKKPFGLRRQPSDSNTRLLFSGTIAESTGVFEAIALAVALHEVDPEITLKIIGYCAQTKTLERVRQTISMHHFISLAGGDKPVAHSEIISAIYQADFGIVCYPLSPHTQNSIPTKLYEYVGCQLPILLQNYEPWSLFSSPYHASLPVDFHHIKVNDLIEKMRNGSFYPKAPASVFWDSEVPAVMAAIRQLIPD